MTTPELFRAAVSAAPATAAHLARIAREIPEAREHVERAIQTWEALGADRVRVCSPRRGWHPDAVELVLAEYAAAGWTVVTGIDAGGDLAILTPRRQPMSVCADQALQIAELRAELKLQQFLVGEKK